MKQVSHRNIVEFYTSYYSDDHKEFITIMELCECDLATIIFKQDGKLFEYDQLITWCCEILCGLRYLHQKRIIHRDIKPDVC